MEVQKVNLHLLHKLLRDNKDAIKKALVLFVETTEEDMAGLGNRIEDRKFFEASRIAHSLKSRFVYLGNDDTCLKMKRLEGLLKDAKNSSISEIEDLFNELNQTIVFCLGELRSEIILLNN